MDDCYTRESDQSISKNSELEYGHLMWAELQQQFCLMLANSRVRREIIYQDVIAEAFLQKTRDLEFSANTATSSASEQLRTSYFGAV